MLLEACLMAFSSVFPKPCKSPRRPNMNAWHASFKAQAWPQGLDLSLSALGWKARENPDHGTLFKKIFAVDYDYDKQQYSDTYSIMMK